MCKLGDCPDGARYDSRAPYNEVENPEVDLDVYVWLTIGKKIKIKVSDYTIKESGIDEDRIPYKVLDYSTCDLWSAIDEKIEAPDGWELVEKDITIDE